MSDMWEEMEKPLRQLLNQVKSNLTASERKEVEEYINGNEFDVAMEALIDFLLEKPAPVSKQALANAKKIAVIMGLNNELARINSDLAGKSS